MVFLMLRVNKALLIQVLYIHFLLLTHKTKYKCHIKNISFVSSYFLMICNKGYKLFLIREFRPTNLLYLYLYTDTEVIGIRMH